MERRVLYSLNPTGSAWSRPRDVPLSNSSANARGIPTRTVKWLGGRSVVHLCSTLMCPSSCVGTLTAPRGFAQTPRSSPFVGGQAALHCSGLARVQPWATASRISKLDWHRIDGCRGPWSVVVRIPVKGWASELVASPKENRLGDSRLPRDIRQETRAGREPLLLFFFEALKI